MAARLNNGISSVTAHEEKDNAKEDEVNDVPALVPVKEEEENERRPIFFEAPPSLSSHISVSSEEDSPVEIVDSTEVTKELVETKSDANRRKPAISSHFSTSPSKETPVKNGDHTEETELVVSSKVVSERNLEPSKDTDLVVWSKAVPERSLEPRKNMEPTISSKRVFARNHDCTKNPELVVQKNDVSEIKTTSKAVLVDTLWSSVDNYPSKYKLILCDVDSQAKVTRAEAITKVRNPYYGRNDVCKMYLRKGLAFRSEIKDTHTRQTGIRESIKDSLSEVELQTIADIVLEKVDAATQTDEVFCAARFRQLEEFRETTVKIDLNSNRPTAAAAAATAIMVPLRNRSSTKSLTIVDFNNLPFIYGRNQKYFAALERSIALSKTPIKWEDVKISWQPTPSCYAPSIASLERDDSISKPFSEMYDEVDQVMDSLRLWELKYSSSSEGQPGFNTDILRQEPDMPNPVTSSITLKDQNPTIEGSLNVQTLQHKVSSESKSKEKSLELLAQSHQEASADDNTELCGTYQPGSSKFEELPQAFNFSFSQFIFPSALIDTNVGHHNPRIEEIDDDISISSEPVASLDISKEARIRRDKEQASISSHPTSSGDFQEEEKPPQLTPVHCGIQGASAVITHSNKPCSRVDPNSEVVVHSGSFEPDENAKGSADDF